MGILNGSFNGIIPLQHNTAFKMPQVSYIYIYNYALAMLYSVGSLNTQLDKRYGLSTRLSCCCFFSSIFLFSLVHYIFIWPFCQYFSI